MREWRAHVHAQTGSIARLTRGIRIALRMTLTSHGHRDLVSRVSTAAPVHRRRVPVWVPLAAIKRLEDAGCAAVVLHSLFEEQITLAPRGRFDTWIRSTASSPWRSRTFPASDDYPFRPARVRGTHHPSKAGGRDSGHRFAQRYVGRIVAPFSRIIEQAGADALELNLYEVVTDLERVRHRRSSTSSSEIVKELKRVLKIPIAVKLSPFFPAFGNVAQQLDAAGADGLVLFNRFYQPDIDIKTMRPSPQLELSASSRAPSAVTVAGDSSRTCPAGLAVTRRRCDAERRHQGAAGRGGCGADWCLRSCATVPAHISAMRQGLERWMEWHKAARLSEVRGRASLRQTEDPAAFERANYIRALQSWSR